MKSDKYHFFWNGPFSQWEACDFLDTSNIKFKCAEQYMMYQKAILFGDVDSAVKILASNDPAIQKRIGRNVKNFNQEIWNSNAKKIVYNGNYLKFTQNNDLLLSLLKTHPLKLVEASPYDKIWGIGLSENDPCCLDETKWLGTNWLGEILTQVRKDIIKDIELRCDAEFIGNRKEN